MNCAIPPYTVTTTWVVPIFREVNVQTIFEPSMPADSRARNWSSNLTLTDPILGTLAFSLIWKEVLYRALICSLPATLVVKAGGAREATGGGSAVFGGVMRPVNRIGTTRPSG